jgi:hypothetical protein
MFKGYMLIKYYFMSPTFSSLSCCLVDPFSSSSEKVILSKGWIMSSEIPSKNIKILDFMFFYPSRQPTSHLKLFKASSAVNVLAFETNVEKALARHIVGIITGFSRLLSL